MALEEILEIVVIDDSANHGEAVANQLRNQGLAIHTESVDSFAQLTTLLRQKAWDLLLLTPECEHFEPIAVMRTVLEQQPQLGIVIVANMATVRINLDDLLEGGAKDIIDIANPSRASHIFRRESAATRFHNELLHCRTLLQESNHRAQILANQSKEAIAYIDEGMHIYANDSYLTLFGYDDFDDLLGVPFLDMLHADSQNSFKSYLRQFQQGRPIEELFEAEGIDLATKSFPLQLSLSRISYEGEACTQIVLYNKEDSQELVRRLEEAKQRDSVTGAYTQQYFVEQFRAIVHQQNRSGHLLLISPDNLNDLRQRLGFSAIEALMSEIYHFLSQELDSSSIKQLILRTEESEPLLLARFGASGFILSLTGVDAHRSEKVAALLTATGRDTIFDLEGRTTQTTFSIAITPYHGKESNYQQVIGEADRLLEQLTAAGGNRYELYTPDVDQLTQREKEKLLAIEIRQALQNNRLLLVYQPIISLNDDPHATYEVMLRMPDLRGEQEFVAANEFFAAVHHCGLSEIVDRWVIAHALLVLKEQRQRQQYPRLFIKLSEQSLVNQTKLFHWMLPRLKSAQLRPWELVFEISEQVATEQLKQVKQFRTMLEKLKIALAINQFGEQSNHLTILQHYDSCYIKISQGLINQLAESPQAVEQINNIVQHAQQYDIQVIANAVENPQTLSRLYATGINYIVGFFIQKPSRQMDYDFNSF
ncbi:sensor domain-containing phosphodiesterase [Ectothiorhodospiraceae bacterium BW-2]|nr:sensor domain-containing phosphodiesterase [Ectothiorhodospiraceae bacterium BW-2]